LSEIFEHIENVIKRQQLNAALEIKKLVQQKKLWSEYYDNQFQGEVKLASNYKAELAQVLDENYKRTYFVQSKAPQDQPSTGHNVTVCTLPQCDERYLKYVLKLFLSIRLTLSTTGTLPQSALAHFLLRVR
jgi:hypothetical protein